MSNSLIAGATISNITLTGATLIGVTMQALIASSPPLLPAGWALTGGVLTHS